MWPFHLTHGGSSALLRPQKTYKTDKKVFFLGKTLKCTGRRTVPQAILKAPRPSLAVQKSKSSSSLALNTPFDAANAQFQIFGARGYVRSMGQEMCSATDTITAHGLVVVC